MFRIDFHKDKQFLLKIEVNEKVINWNDPRSNRLRKNLEESIVEATNQSAALKRVTHWIENVHIWMISEKE